MRPGRLPRLALSAGLCAWAVIGAAAAAPVGLPQHGGGTLSLDAPAQRIVSLAPEVL